MNGAIPQADMRFLALLVHKGRITEAEARRALAEAPQGDLDLRDWLHSTGILPRREWDAWRVAGGRPPALQGYRVLGRLGEGGCAEVFHAAAADGREVALKVARSEVAEAPAALERFLGEGRLLVGLRHPGLVKGFKVARQEQVVYMVLEYLPGETALDRLLAGGRFAEQEALGVCLQVARTLGYLAGEGIVHRDVKPGNIMVLPGGDVKLLDLGFAVGAADDEDGELTSGTAHYMAPEQARGEEVDPRADIYSLGVTLYHMVTGELPYDEGDRRTVMRAHLEERLSTRSLKGRAFTPLLAYFIGKMTAREPHIRYQDPAALVADLEEKTAGFAQIREEGRVAPRPRGRRPGRRRGR